MQLVARRESCVVAGVGVAGMEELLLRRTIPTSLERGNLNLVLFHYDFTSPATNNLHKNALLPFIFTFVTLSIILQQSLESRQACVEQQD
jgi:hypothetical protein